MLVFIVVNIYQLCMKGISVGPYNSVNVVLFDLISQFTINGSYVLYLYPGNKITLKIYPVTCLESGFYYGFYVTEVLFFLSRPTVFLTVSDI